MANEINVVFTGNIGQMAENKTSASGRNYLTFSVAVTPGKKQPDGSYVDGETMWLRVTSFGGQDAIDFLKGTRVKVTGRLTQRTADNGKTYNDVVADELEIIKRERDASPTFAPTHVPATSFDDLPF